MYDLSLHVRWLRPFILLFFSSLSLSGGVSSLTRSERSTGLLAGRARSATLDSQGRTLVGDDLDATDEVQPSQRAKDWVRSTAAYFLHKSDGLTFNEKLPTGTQFGDVECDGVTNCQFKTFAAARDFCNSNTTCDGILQVTRGAETGCDGGLGCFFPAKGHLRTDMEWRREGGKTYERQVLAYNRFQDSRKLDDVFPVGTRGCIGVHYCQFLELKGALDFCDHDGECLGVMKMPVQVYGEGCKEGKGCFTPAKGNILHDPLWLKNLGETFLKEQEVAYSLRDSDGKIYDGRFPAGKAGCHGVHNCQFKTLSDAQAYCDADPSCKGVVRKVPAAGSQDCAGGYGCFEPCKGKLKYDAMFLVMEGQMYERRIVR